VNSTLRRTSTVVAVVVFVGALLQPFGRDAAAWSSRHDEPRKSGLNGVWRVTITPRNCATGGPTPIPPFEALFTFHRDGTMSAWVQNSTITVTRSPSHGLWRREHGWNDYSFKFVHLRYNLATGVFLGKQESSATLELGHDGDEFTTDSSTTVFDASGNPAVPTCANGVGVRFALDE
jgi:hypothetical protein